MCKSGFVANKKTINYDRELKIKIKLHSFTN